MNDPYEKLPLLVNGRLNEQERLEMERHLAEDPALAQEAELLMALRAGMQENATTPGALGLARLKRDIERETQGASHAPPTKGYWKPVALTACALFGLQTMLLINPVDWRGTAPATDIVPLSGEREVQGPALQVIFDDTATAAQMRTALQSVQGTIVDGPGALGVYTLVLPKGADASQATHTLSALVFVELVTPL